MRKREKRLKIKSGHKGHEGNTEVTKILLGIQRKRLSCAEGMGKLALKKAGD